MSETIAERALAAQAYLDATKVALNKDKQELEGYDPYRCGLINAMIQGAMGCKEFATLDARMVMFAIGTAAGSGFNAVPQEHWPLLVEALNAGLQNGIAVYSMQTEGNA